MPVGGYQKTNRGSAHFNEKYVKVIRMNVFEHMLKISRTEKVWMK